MSNKAYIVDGHLRAYKKGFNGVSSNPSSKKNRCIEPFRYQREIYPTALKETMIKLIKSNFHSAILKYGEYYLHFEIRSGILKRVSDLEILLIPDKHEIHFRSVSRVGFWDLGFNRRLINKIQKFLQQEIQSHHSLNH